MENMLSQRDSKLETQFSGERKGGEARTGECPEQEVERGGVLVVLNDVVMGQLTSKRK